jgi:hypothetical protein
MRTFIIALLLTVPAYARDGYTYGVTSDGQRWWQQCEPNGYCYGRQDNQTWWSQSSPSEPDRRRHPTELR